MAFSDMNDVEQELGEEKPPKRNGNGNGNRTFLIIAGTLGGIMVLALLCIAGLALYRYIPAQRAAQSSCAAVPAGSFSSLARGRHAVTARDRRKYSRPAASNPCQTVAGPAN